MSIRANKGTNLGISKSSFFKLAIQILLPLSLGQAEYQARQINGFFMYCTSNNDGTGSCTNEEDNKAFSCLIVPGQIITCPVNASQSVECVWISGISANQAQFWCDPEDEAAMYAPIRQSLDQPVLEDSQINNDEFKRPQQQQSEPALDTKIFQGAF